MLLYCVAYVCAYVREKVMFEVYGGESESMSDQWKFLFILPYDSFNAGLSCYFSEYLVNGERYSRHYYCNQIEKSGICHRKVPLRMLCIMISTYIRKVIKFLEII